MSVTALGASSTVVSSGPCPAGCKCQGCRDADLKAKAFGSPNKGASPLDTVEISHQAKSLADKGESVGANGKPLDEPQQKQVKELKDRDREVRQHEAAHLAAAGGNATGGPSYTYQKGPDGQQYAVGGEVNVDTSDEKTPEATLRKMEQIQRAALAPAEPSGQDHSVAAAAAAKAAQARQEIAAANGPDSASVHRTAKPDAVNGKRSSYESDHESTRGRQLDLVA